LIEADFGSGMKPNDDIGQISHQLRSKFPRFGKLVEKIALGKTLHLHDPICNGPIPVESQIAIHYPCNGVKAEVEGTSSPTINTLSLDP
jgi:hypothetical protein